MLLTSFVLAVLSAPPDPGACWSYGYHDGECNVSGALKVATRVDPAPPALTKKYGASARVFAIDLDSDGKDDFVVEVPQPKQGLKTCFVSSTGVQHHCSKGITGFDGFSLRWFAQLDDGPMLELFEMSGDEDSNDYTLMRLDPTTWRPTRVLGLNPLLRTKADDARETYWGYPWDVRDLKWRMRDGRIEILSTVACVAASRRAPNEATVFFAGTPSQGEPSDNYVAEWKAAKYRSLAELEALARHPTTCATH